MNKMNEQYNGPERKTYKATPLKKRRRKIRKSVIWVGISVIVLAAVFIFLAGALNASKNQVAGVTVSLATSTPAPTAAATAASTPAPSAAPKPTTSADTSAWGAKFAGKFTDGAVEKTENSYKSANINISIKSEKTNGMVYYVADIYIKDLKYLKTAFANGKFASNSRQPTDVTAKKNNAILAINGDYCSYNAGPVVRNGTVYRDGKKADVLAMYNDGSMETYTKDEFDMTKAKAKGVYQVWTFGPMLLKDGKPISEFTSSISKSNPRTGIGYYEPGHYCFVVEDGRQPGYSQGITLQDWSKVFYSLGCKVAFNLDGGQTSEMVFMGSFVNKPYNGGRSVSDIVYIAE